MSRMCCSSMLKQVDALPCSKRRGPIDDRHGELHVRQCRAQMSRHIVRPFIIMVIAPRVFRRDPREIGFEVPPGGGRGILLDKKRSGGVLAKDCEKTCNDPAVMNPTQDRPGHLMEPLPWCFDREDHRSLPHGASYAKVHFSGSRSNWRTARGVTQGSRRIVQFSYCGTSPAASAKLATGSSTSSPTRFAKRDPHAAQYSR